MKLLYFFIIFFQLCFGFNPILYKIKNPVIAGSSLILGKKYISTISKQHLDVNLSRKLIHITCAPSFICSWIFYNDFYPNLCGLFVPILSSIYLIYKKDNLKEYISRSGKSNELLKGPLIYTLILSFLTYKYWLYNEYGIISMLQLSIGDGFADIIGRKYGKHKWFFNKKKSIEGTIGFFVTSFLGNLLFLKLLILFNYNYNITILKILKISIFSSFVELIPFIDDNISIPFFNILFMKYL
tara:strand:+ start:228 stop:950 length:723 start_codon:yes stop_codon:yes gene_type:complete